MSAIDNGSEATDRAALRRFTNEHVSAVRAACSTNERVYIGIDGEGREFAVMTRNYTPQHITINSLPRIAIY